MSILPLRDNLGCTMQEVAWMVAAGVNEAEVERMSDDAGSEDWPRRDEHERLRK